MKEIWKDIKDYEGLYQISNLGRVKSLKGIKERILKGAYNAQGYLHVSLSINNIKKTFKIHQLVANYFIVNHDNKEEINHIDGVKNNNNVNNLEWSTRQENAKHASNNALYERGSGRYNHVLNEKDVLKIRQLYADGVYSSVKLGMMYGVSTTNIFNIVNRKRWKHI